MTRVMLDSNICIYLMKRQPPAVMERFAEYRKGDVLVSSISWAELWCGMDETGQTAMALFRQLVEVADFDVAAAEYFGKLSRLHPNRKKSFDRMIAAHALALDATLVTNNLVGFAPYQSNGLKLVNWV